MAVRDSRAAKPRMPRRPATPVAAGRAGETALGKGITMWGAPGTGKTTFLAALYTALLDQETGWWLRGADEPSTEVLVSFTNTLAEKGVYPVQTVGIKNYRWSLVGTMPRALREWHWYGPRRLDTNVVIPLDLVDAAGEVADTSVIASREATKRFVDHLESSAGIVFCYDPIREFTEGDTFRHTFGVLAQLDSKMNRRGKLPHHVAVCITKFDEQRVFDAAARMGVIEYDEAPPCFPGCPGRTRGSSSTGFVPCRGRIARTGFCSCLSGISSPAGSSSSSPRRSASTWTGIPASSIRRITSSTSHARRKKKSRGSGAWSGR